MLAIHNEVESIAFLLTRVVKVENSSNAYPNETSFKNKMKSKVNLYRSQLHVELVFNDFSSCIAICGTKFDKSLKINREGIENIYELFCLSQQRIFFHQTLKHGPFTIETMKI